MPFVKPRFEKRKCPCCEKFFEPTSPTQIYCTASFCLRARPAWIARVAERTKATAQAAQTAEQERLLAREQELSRSGASGPCPDCGGGKAHIPGCLTVRLAKPCYICGRVLSRTALGPDRLSRDHLVPRDVVRRETAPYRPDPAENVVLVHERCNIWKDNRLPHHIAGLQPPWGIKPGVPKLALEGVWHR
jgi:5-methylcytosine-specific restriction endonuclease McrA